MLEELLCFFECIQANVTRIIGVEEVFKEEEKGEEEWESERKKVIVIVY